MASARARLGAARRGIIRRKKKADVVTGALSTIGTVAAFGAAQAKKAGTAWEEYEAGYKELGGEGFERPKFGQKGYFKGPEGDVRIGGKMYSREKIQEAGSFLGSDAAAILSPEQREQYLGRTAPGTKALGSIEGFDYSSLKGSGISPAEYDLKVAKVQAENISIPSTTIRKSEDQKSNYLQNLKKVDPTPTMFQRGENIWSKFKSGAKERFQEHGFGMGFLKMTHPAASFIQAQNQNQPTEGQVDLYNQNSKRNLMESLDGNQQRTIQQGNIQKPWWQIGEDEGYGKLQR